MSAGSLDDEPANLVRHGHHLDNGATAGVSAIFAPLAAAPPIKRDAVEEGRVNAQIFVHLGWISEGFLADQAHPAHQPLGTGKDDRRGNQEWRDAHIVEARYGARGVIAVDGAEHL